MGLPQHEESGLLGSLAMGRGVAAWLAVPLNTASSLA
jgi:hypothetical protein